MKCLDSANFSTVNLNMKFIYDEQPNLSGCGVIRVNDEEEIDQVVKECVKEKVPIIPLGSGTTNFGQLIPNKPSLFVDLSQFNGVIDEDTTSVKVRSGTKVIDILNRLRREGKTLPVYPSSFAISTIGGFIEGGSGGPGSFKYGTHFRVLTREMDLIAYEDLKLSGKEILGVTHAWGTTGVLKEATLNIVDDQDYEMQYVPFSDLESLRKEIEVLFDQKDRVNLVSVYNKEGFTSIFGEQEEKEWILVVSSSKSIGSNLKTDEKLSFATTVRPNSKWFGAKLSLKEINVMKEVKRGVIHGEVMNHFGEPVIFMDVFTRENLKMRENKFNTVKERLLGLDKEVLNEVMELKRRVDPWDIFNPGKL
ncbi:FAD-binding oxidoreductase [Sulfuracidifex tepidarius]|uniref:FAD-binding PCMH-type domain-containing protein n=1 Tax=Sulfuracidifex tepidarius TaxID=1294262 RepID=A0A510E709_9CREN|nr:FAD-binding oxidoreductase [Sulfuracidifex tepidarius]BBG25039.1 hypothetical protein IC006_2374 [Sulfuracidifex tepidarius]BBG27820.1 hypothetical protein IC007_2375 [Sulfuracidifex tepidarius]